MTLCLSLLVATALSAAPASMEAGRFELRSNPWVNLHQRLLFASRFPEDPLGNPPAGLSPDEANVWNEAVAGYRGEVGGRVPFVDTGLIAANRALSDHRGDAPPEGLPPALAEAMARAMPVYMRHQWSSDDRANRFWMAVARPMIEAAGEDLVREHERAYGRPFPRKIRVDVSALGWEFGAYTVGDASFAHSVISSRDPGYQGFNALEMVFHEASHGVVASYGGAIGDEIQQSAKELGVLPRRALWHAIQFLTAGELTRRWLAERGVVYEPYVTGMWDRGFRGLKDAVQTHWIAFLDGKVTREEAIRAIVEATSEVRAPAAEKK